MEATELMVGNFVRCGLRYMKVTQLAEDMDCDDINPIPIIPEILEKNGFEKGRLNVSPQYYFEDNDVFIGVTLKDIPDKHKGIDIAKGKLYFQYDISYIEGPIYVHQLQHALRLCGIKKEIVL